MLYYKASVCTVQLSRGRESGLRQEVVSLRQENKDLRYNASLLEEDNQTLREEIQDLRGKTVILFYTEGYFYNTCNTHQ